MCDNSQLGEGPYILAEPRRKVIEDDVISSEIPSCNQRISIRVLLPQHRCEGQKQRDFHIMFPVKDAIHIGNDDVRLACPNCGYQTSFLELISFLR